MLNLQRGAQLIELMLAAGLFVAVEQAVGEFLAALSVSIFWMRTGQARERFFRQALALRAVLSSCTSRKTQRVARSMATNR
jgi:hypothetical protein